jgi:hypothetical protein
LYPSEGCGWYMFDDVMAAKRWLERFAELGMAGVTATGCGIDIPAKIADQILLTKSERKALKRDGTGHRFNFTVTEAKLFIPDENQPLPFAFIPEDFAERARLRREEPGQRR